MNWKETALQALKDSLFPIPTELNGIDWKSGLSCKTERLAQHISAFANNKGGGVLVFGVDNDGACHSIDKQEADNIVQQMGNIARNNLAFSIQIEHSILEYQGCSLLFIHIPEQKDKPVYLRGKTLYEAYCRSAGQTTKMSRNQVKALISESQGISFEERIAKEQLTATEVLRLLNHEKYYELSNRSIPKAQSDVINRFVEEKFCKEDNGKWSITNLGAILFANNIEEFEELKNYSVIVRKYTGTNNRNLLHEQVGRYGYAVGFKGLVDFIVKLTSTEQINTLREDIPTYPLIAIREFVANALIHRDFAITGMNTVIEIFSNRLIITNPGPPLHDVNRLIDLPPYSRNEILAQKMMELHICERRGSGIDRAVEAIEKMFLPAPKITKGEQYTKVSLFPQKNVNQMTKAEKIRACYQHACLMYEDNATINNQSIRERFELNKNQSSVASRIITDTLEAGLIKISDTDIKSKKYATYIPYYG